MSSVCNHLQFENTIDISFFSGKMSQRQPIGGPPSDTWPYTKKSYVMRGLLVLCGTFKYAPSMPNVCTPHLEYPWANVVNELGQLFYTMGP